MGLQQSKDRLLYQQVSNGNVEGVKNLFHLGASLEWRDKKGKTPLILASMDPHSYDVAETLIALGAHVSAYRSGRHGGTPLHHAARSGLEQMVNLLLSKGANALTSSMNDDCQTALDIARAKGYSNIVRAIESHICLFSGWMQELYIPGFFEFLAPHLPSKKVWVVVVPRGARIRKTPWHLELAIYSSLQDAKPRTIIALSKATIDGSNIDQPNPTVVISGSKIPRRWRRKRSILHSQVKQLRIKLAPVKENEKQQLKQLRDACKGITQVIRPAFPFNNEGPYVGLLVQTTPEDRELALSINNASLQSNSEVGSTAPNTYLASGSTTSSGSTNATTQNSGTAVHNIVYHPNSDANTYAQNVPTTPNNIGVSAVVPSAPPLSEMVDDGPVHYPSIDYTPMDLYEDRIGEKDVKKNHSSSCVVCKGAPAEGACVPCGHMAGCMTCLNQIKGRGCPVCRSKVHQLIRIYPV